VTGQLLGAYLTGGFVGLLTGAIGTVALVSQLLERVDGGTTLPVPADEPPTERIARAADVIDLPRRHRATTRTWAL
jgi:hypothetical protein